MSASMDRNLFRERAARQKRLDAAMLANETLEYVMQNDTVVNSLISYWLYDGGYDFEAALCNALAALVRQKGKLVERLLSPLREGK